MANAFKTTMANIKESEVESCFAGDLRFSWKVLRYLSKVLLFEYWKLRKLHA
jgi:hypothetical protein